MSRPSNADWIAYYETSAGRPPRPIFVDALTRFETNLAESTPRYAIDLGCGGGTESLALLHNGWRVLAIDREPAAIDYVLSKATGAHRARLETRVASLEGLSLPPADFVHAGYSLPYCAPAYFDRLWRAIATSICLNGRFAGQLFGVRDSWASNTDMTFHTAEQVERLLHGVFVVELLQEVDEDGDSFRGAKHWHIFDIIARKVQQTSE